MEVEFGDPEAKAQLEKAKEELKGYLKGIVSSVQARGKRLDAELDKLNVFTQGAVLTGAFFTGLYNEALDVVDAAIMIAETGIEAITEIEKAKQKALSIIIKGDINAAKQELEELVAYGEETYDTMQETYDTLQLLYTDDEIKTLLMEFPEKYLEAMPAVEKAEAASGLALSLLFALVTGGAGTAVSAAAKAPIFIKAANKIKEIIALIKKVKLHRKQRKGHNTKIAEREDKPKKDKLKEKEKRECKDDNCKDATDNKSLVGQLEPGNPRSTSIPRNGDRLVLTQGPFPTCGPNSCAMVLDSSGRAFDLNTLIIDSKVTHQGAYLGDMAAALRNQGLNTARVKNRVSIDELAKATSRGNPAVVATRLDRGGHAVVVDGITTRQGQRVVAIRDPALGRQYFTPLNEFTQRFSGHTILTNPITP